MVRPSSAAAGGETYIPIPDEDEDQLQRRAGAVAKLENRLNLLELPATAIAGWGTGGACMVGRGNVLGNPGALAAQVLEEAEHGRRLVEGAVLAEECAVTEGAVPGLVDAGGADEARRVFWREVEEDLADGVVRELWGRRQRHLHRSRLDQGG